jgi:hypothetical protein
MGVIAMEAFINCEKLSCGDNGKPVLRLSLTSAGREIIEEERLLETPVNNALSRLLEWQLANGLEWIAPEEIGALTNAPILSDDVERDDYGNLLSVTTLYWFPNYQILSEVRELYERGYVEFELAA